MQTLTDGFKAKLVDVETLERNPFEAGNVIEPLESRTTFDANLEKEIDGAAHYARVRIAVGLAEEIVQLRRLNHHSRLLLDLTAHALFGSFVEVKESSYQVASSFGWIVGATSTEQFTLIVDDNGNGGSAWIGIIGEPAIVTMTGIRTMFHEFGTAAEGAEVESVKGMIGSHHGRRI